tara:strand:+ start:711 stop:845 length:135 start_codon:yes stop_codon:yes gene_type:complete
MRGLRKAIVGRMADGGDHTGRWDGSLHSPGVDGLGVVVREPAGG